MSLSRILWETDTKMDVIVICHCTYLSFIHFILYINAFFSRFLTVKSIATQNNGRVSSVNFANLSWI
jgi:hypothetical protein